MIYTTPQAVIDVFKSDMPYLGNPPLSLYAAPDLFCRISIHRVIAIVCSEFGVDVTQKSRKHNIVLPRLIAVYLVKTYTAKTHQDVANALGYKNHCIVTYATRIVSDLVDTKDKLYYSKIITLKSKLDELHRRAVGNDQTVLSDGAEPQGNRVSRRKRTIRRV